MSYSKDFYGPVHPQSMVSSTVAAYAVLLSIFIYYILQYLEYTILPLLGLFWNMAVYITPSQVISMLDTDFRKSRIKESSLTNSNFESKEHASKSDAIRRILGLDGAWLMTTMQRATNMRNMSRMFKTTPKTGLPGLGNWDNSCYQNSVLQGLAALEAFPKFLDPSTSGSSVQPTKKALRETIEKLNDPENLGKTFWTPSELKSMSSSQQQDAQEYLSKISDQLEKETVRELKPKGDRPKLKRTFSRVESDSTSISGEQHQTNGLKRVSSVAQLPDEISSLIIRNPLEGLIAQRVGCQRCGYVAGLSMVPFNCLTVPLGRQWMYDVHDCLDEYTALEPISGVECITCTLSQTKKQLEKVLSRHKRERDQSEGTSAVDNLAFCKSQQEKLEMVKKALDDEDFSDQILKNCRIQPKQRVLTTKSRQAVVARSPSCLIIHFNRSNYNEVTGMQSKNCAQVEFPPRLDLAPWSLGHNAACAEDEIAVESWNVDPTKSMLDVHQDIREMAAERTYQLRAVITHYGRHENGHYICYRRSPRNTKSQDGDPEDTKDSWWRLSDEEVIEVDEETVLAQGGVFMLFYEKVESCESPKQVQFSQEEQVVEAPGTVISDESVNPFAIIDAQKLPATKVQAQSEDEGRSVSHVNPSPPLSPRVPQLVEECEDTHHSDAEAQSISTTDTPTTVPTSAISSMSKLPEKTDPNALEPRQKTPTPRSESAAPAILEPNPSSDPVTESTEVTMPSSNKGTVSLSPVSMRTAGPRGTRGNGSRAGKAMGSVAGIVQAN